MKLTKQIGLMLLVLSTLSAQASHEAKGGDPLKNRFRQVGRFLIYHLQNKQVRLSARLKSFDNFQKTVPAVPIELVDSFPAGTLNEALTGMTVTDATSPVGKKILLHRARFAAAVNRFDSGEDVQVPTLNGQQLVEVSFLAFCFHEFLLSSKEEDTQLEISSLLSATKQELATWQRAYGALEDRIVYLALPRTIGPLVASTGDEQTDRQTALDGFLSAYAATGHAAEDAALAKVRDQLQAKVPVIKADISGDRMTSQTLFFDDGGEEQAAAYFYQTEKIASIYLDTDAQVQEVSVDTPIVGPVVGPMIGDGYSDVAQVKSTAARAYTMAYEGFLAQAEKRLPELEKSYRQLYGDDFLFVDYRYVELHVPRYEHDLYGEQYGMKLNLEWPTAQIFFRASAIVHLLQR